MSADKGEFAGNDYFLARIKELEKIYQMRWWEFMAQYEGDLESLAGHNGIASVDYSEWAFLCENFYAELMAIGDSPPYEMTTDAVGSQKPELSSGFCFKRGDSERRSALLRHSPEHHRYGGQRRDRAGGAKMEPRQTELASC
ncbi:MAG TPA: hypothetical protein VMX16_13705 [Terriglobia bacterium]|nr:hypothetical protein [Terriglobia bacterium]